VKGPTPRRLQKYVTRCLGLRAYVRAPGDGRVQPQIPASALLWGLLIGQVLRDYAFHAIEALVHLEARALGVSRAFSDDALGYFTERWDPPPPAAPWPTACAAPNATRFSTAATSSG
jgi:hypothetical protein